MTKQNKTTKNFTLIWKQKNFNGNVVLTSKSFSTDSEMQAFETKLAKKSCFDSIFAHVDKDVELLTGTTLKWQEINEDGYVETKERSFPNVVRMLKFKALLLEMPNLNCLLLS